MDRTYHHTKLTAAEVGSLWMQYLSDSLSKCVLRHFIYHVKDEAIEKVLSFALQLSELHLERIKEFFTKEDLPIPEGFTDKDVVIDAPPLFTDTFMITYIHTMSIHGMTRYSGAIGTVLREDVRKYFIQCSSEATDLYNRATEVVLHKGIISKPPTLTNKYTVEYISNQSFLAGWFGDRRPINAIEIGGTYLNMHKTSVKVVLEMGFRQVTRLKEIEQFMTRAEKLCKKHSTILSKMLTDDNLHAPKTYEDEVTDATVSPFSEKLMMYHIASLLSSAIGYYGEALSMCQRRDLSASYVKMITEMGLLAEDGVEILIDHGWLEQPPGAPDREKLKNV
jgi:hypothetical protein